MSITLDGSGVGQTLNSIGYAKVAECQGGWWESHWLRDRVITPAGSVPLLLVEVPEIAMIAIPPAEWPALYRRTYFREHVRAGRIRPTHSIKQIWSLRPTSSSRPDRCNDLRNRHRVVKPNERRAGM